MVSWIIASIIFLYAGYSLYTFISRSKQGKCAACELNKHCDKGTSCPSEGNQLMFVKQGSKTNK
ncbi:FeoB-associated Cys-rich membrane protein [Salipaludibacillus daqingensis]|uniref:FeoB-associated Cys-rich membrane protein n=1 Tax=Salipaludibacillus daqingensis TaxID=3041001 RepID=UPI0024730EBE|nr:FeoB-associated Cys-rich membrane protein [Salipaludibacillus daqingensis]